MFIVYIQILSNLINQSWLLTFEYFQVHFIKLCCTKLNILGQDSTDLANQIQIFILFYFIKFDSIKITIFLRNSSRLGCSNSYNFPIFFIQLDSSKTINFYLSEMAILIRIQEFFIGIDHSAQQIITRFVKLSCLHSNDFQFDFIRHDWLYF